jgi:protein TonB
MLLAALAAAAAIGGPIAVDLPTITAPDWRRKATGADVMKVYPGRALRRGVSGAALVACSVSKEGTLVDCSVIEETPVGEGFGEAALKLTRLYVMRPLTKDGLAVEGGKVRMPLRFISAR